jgi:hypothetical protein
MQRNSCIRNDTEHIMTHSARMLFCTSRSRAGGAQPITAPGERDQQGCGTLSLYTESCRLMITGSNHSRVP